VDQEQLTDEYKHRSGVEGTIIAVEASHSCRLIQETAPIEQRKKHKHTQTHIAITHSKHTEENNERKILLYYYMPLSSLFIRYIDSVHDINTQTEQTDTN